MNPVPAPASHQMRYVFPAEITDLDTAHGLPTETLIRALNMRWLIDGCGTCWPAGSGSGMTLSDLLAHGPLNIEWLPPIDPGAELEALDRHLALAVARRRHIDEGAAALLTIPEPVAATHEARNRASWRIGYISGVAPTLPALGVNLRTDLTAWLADRLAELNLTIEQAREMTAQKPPLIPTLPTPSVFPVTPFPTMLPVFPTASTPGSAVPVDDTFTEVKEAPDA